MRIGRKWRGLIDSTVVAVIEAILNNGGIAEVKVEGDRIVVVEINRKVKGRIKAKN